MTPIEVMEAIIAENLENDPHFYDPPERAERAAAEAIQQAKPKFHAYSSSTSFQPYGSYGSNNSPVPLDWVRSSGSNTVAYR